MQRKRQNPEGQRLLFPWKLRDPELPFPTPIVNIYDLRTEDHVSQRNTDSHLGDMSCEVLFPRPILDQRSPLLAGVMRGAGRLLFTLLTYVPVKVLSTNIKSYDPQNNPMRQVLFLY